MKKRTPKEILELLESKLPALQKMINIQFRIEPELKIEMQESKNRIDFTISSDKIKGTSGLLDAMFKEVHFSFWGGEYYEGRESIYYQPKIFWTSNSGGSNGTDVFWNTLLFDLETESWIASRPFA